MKRMRYVIGGALVLGIVAGVWLSDLLKGLGSGNGVGIGQAGLEGVAVQVDPATTGSDLGLSSESTTGVAATSLKVLIKDRGYFLRTGDLDSPIDLEALVPMVQAATGDDDGIKLRIYRSGTARVTAELQLREALRAADVAEGAIYTSPGITE
jgi:hypothetical protein